MKLQPTSVRREADLVMTSTALKTVPIAWFGTTAPERL